jgi:superfamily I DNA and/or RNA helicase
VVSALARADRALVIGDVHQLEPVVEITEADEARVLRKLNMTSRLASLEPFRVHAAAGNSAQALARRAVTEVPTLRDHFRCQPAIIEVSNRLCGYNLVVRTPPASLGAQVPWLRGPIMGLAVRGVQRQHLGSWRNDEELDQVVSLVVGLLRAGLPAERIATLTPYRGQHQALEEALRRAGVPRERFASQESGRDGGQGDLFGPAPAGGVAIGTLHRFQGAERDVVILSTVIDRRASLSFTNDRVNLINVAVSRARLHLIVVGNPELLALGRVTSALVAAIPDDCWL